MLQKTPLGGGGGDKPPIWASLISFIVLIILMGCIVWLLFAPGENAP